MTLAFHFLRPGWLLALLPVLVIGWLLRRRQDRLSSWKQVIDPHLLKHLLVGRNAHQRLRPLHALVLTWALATLALAGPTWRQQPSPFASDEAGLVVLLKVSGTMMATDVQPSRLIRAKQKLRDLLDQRQGAASALIVYSGSAHLVMPLTKDTDIINTMVEDLTPDLMPRDGDALAQALQDAKELLDSTGTPGSVLVIADAVSPAQVEALDSFKSDLPTQFLAVQPLGAPLDPGLEAAARSLRASVVPMTIDEVDVTRLAQQARRDLKSATASGTGDHWQDTGYALLPVIALGVLLWSRKGWVVS